MTGRAARPFESISELEAAYGPRWDSGDGVGWAGLYSSDGVFALILPDSSIAVRARGCEELSNYCNTFNESKRVVHMLGHPEITIQGDQARSIVPFSAWAYSLSGEESFAVVGFYKVEYGQQAGGWVMRTRLEIPTIRRTRLTLMRDLSEISWLSEDAVPSVGESGR